MRLLFSDYRFSKLPPLDAFEYSLNLNADNLCCDRITQHVLYLSSQHDHFVPIIMHKKQVSLFKNVKSLEDKVNTKHQQVENHLKIGNIGLILQVVLSWLANKV
jgi:hypothetical protein